MGRRSGPFTDFGKKVKDLFDSKKYELNRKLKVTARSDNTEWTTEHTFPVASGGKTKHKTTYKQSDKKYGTMKVDVEPNKAKFDYTTPKLVDGLKSNVIVEYPKVTYKGAYKHSKFDALAEVCVDSANTSQTAIGVEAKTEVQPNLFLGGSVDYDTGKGGVSAYAVGAHYVKGNTQLSLKTGGDKMESVKVQLHKKYSDSGEVAAQYDLDLASYQPTCTVGGKWSLDDNSAVQGFVKSDGMAYLLYKHKLSDRLTGNLGTKFEVHNVQDVNMHYKFEFTA